MEVCGRMKVGWNGDGVRIGMGLGWIWVWSGDGYKMEIDRGRRWV